MKKRQTKTSRRKKILSWTRFRCGGIRKWLCSCSDVPQLSIEPCRILMKFVASSWGTFEFFEKCSNSPLKLLRKAIQTIKIKTQHVIPMLCERLEVENIPTDKASSTSSSGVLNSTVRTSIGACISREFEGKFSFAFFNSDTFHSCLSFQFGWITRLNVYVTFAKKKTKQMRKNNAIQKEHSVTKKKTLITETRLFCLKFLYRKYD
jgi:hypothetical protein